VCGKSQQCRLPNPGSDFKLRCFGTICQQVVPILGTSSLHIIYTPKKPLLRATRKPSSLPPKIIQSLTPIKQRKSLPDPNHSGPPLVQNHFHYHFICVENLALSTLTKFHLITMPKYYTFRREMIPWNRKYECGQVQNSR
jgi:hypothetical protein